MKIEGPIEGWARDAINALPGIRAGITPDAALTVDGRRLPMWIEIKRAVDAGSAHVVADQVRQYRVPAIVVAESITASARQYFEESGIGYVDARGNAHLRAPGILVHVAVPMDEKARARVDGPVRLAGKAGLVAQVLLLELPGRQWRIAELAEATHGVSVGLIHKVLNRLEDVSLVASEGSGPHRRRRLTNAPALLDLLAEEDHERHVRRYPAYVYSPLQGSIAGMCSKSLSMAEVEHAITGVAAASLAVSALTTVPVTEIRIAAAADAAAAMSALTARPVEQGANCVLIQAPTDTELVLRRPERDTWLAAPTRIYLDALRDPRRGEEQAEAYRREVLAL